jgi:sulfatase modifying factor 1
MGITHFAPDPLRQTVEAATGGENTVLYDRSGNPSIMVVVPRFNLEDINPELGSGPHPAFVIHGRTITEFFIGKFQASLVSEMAVSVPGVDPTVRIDWPSASRACSLKGDGWHMTTNAEWSAIALLAHRRGVDPHGNTQYGRDYAHPYETGRRQDGLAPGMASGEGRHLTGSGPVSWYHNGDRTGIADLCGNVWEWQRGLRLVEGEIQIIPDNNAAEDIDHGQGSPLWQALSADGSLSAPGAEGTLKWEAENADGSGTPRLSTSVSCRSDGSTYATTKFGSITMNGSSAPRLAKILGLYPLAPSDGRGSVYIRNVGVRYPFRGGAWIHGGNAGLSALNLADGPSVALPYLGFRVAYHSRANDHRTH